MQCVVCVSLQKTTSAILALLRAGCKRKNVPFGARHVTVPPISHTSHVFSHSNRTVIVLSDSVQMTDWLAVPLAQSDARTASPRGRPRGSSARCARPTAAIGRTSGRPVPPAQPVISALVTCGLRRRSDAACAPRATSARVVWSGGTCARMVLGVGRRAFRTKTIPPEPDRQPSSTTSSGGGLAPCAALHGAVREP